MNIEEIKTIVELMSDHDLTEFKIDSENTNLCIKRGCGHSAPVVVQQAHIPQQILAAAVQQQAEAAAPPPSVPAPPRVTIDAPIVGTFYRSPSPEAPVYVKHGDKVNPDTLVCMIEAMKVMNEIKAEKSGVIKEILVENAKPVEYGQPLFVIE
jgi:acetyl-CoA carboxylase biotin carboxyl carrier protein